MVDVAAELDFTCVSQHFDKVDSTSKDLPFVDPKQRFFLFSTSHKEVPPVATDPSNPGVRIYGCYATQSDAVSSSRKIKEADPNVSLFLGRTHEWTLMCDSIKKMQDESYVSEKTSTLLKRQKVELSVREAKFKQHQEEMRANTSNETNQSLESVKNEDLVVVEEEVVPRVEDLENRTPTPIPTNILPPKQSFVCVSFVDDDKKTETPELLFKVYMICETEAEAERYVKNVVTQKILDDDVFVFDVAEWVFPVTDRKHVKRQYRDKRLNDLMDRDVDSEEAMRRANVPNPNAEE